MEQDVIAQPIRALAALSRYFDADKKYLRHVYELKYEEYITDPGANIRKIASFVGIDPSSCSATELSDDYNQRYLDRWREMLQGSPFRTYYRQIASMYEESFAAYGYSLAEPFNGKPFSFGRDTPLRRVVGAPLRLAGDLGAILWRTLGILEWRAIPLWRRLWSTRQPKGSGAEPRQFSPRPRARPRMTTVGGSSRITDDEANRCG